MSGVQRFWEKLWEKLREFFISIDDAANFLTNDDIDVEDVVLKSKDVYGKNNLGSGGQCLPGLVPSSHLQAQGTNLYLRNDGTWVKPIEHSYGTATISSNYSTSINFRFVPTIVKVWDSDGKLVNISKNNATSGAITPDKIFGSNTFSNGNNTQTWTFNGAAGTYAYEALKE